MLAIKGHFDGKAIKILEDVSIQKPQEVIITFLGREEQDDIGSIAKIAEQGGSFDFLKDDAEDIYTDDDLKIKYAK